MAVPIRWFNPGDKIFWRGRWFDKAFVTAARAKEAQQGYEDYYFQGSYNGGVNASAGTHDGGGAGDIVAKGLASRKRAARFGIIGWQRTPAQGFDLHEHVMLMWDSRASAGLKAQMHAWRAGRNGLANNGRDDSGVRKDYRHYLDWRLAEHNKTKRQVGPNCCIDAVEKSRRYGSQVRSYGSVKLVQTALNKLYPDNKKLLVDGVLGPVTLRQYNKFRRAAFGADAAQGSIGHTSLKLLFKRADMVVNVWDKAESNGGKIQ